MKFDFDWGEIWRSTFKKLLWLSFSAIEITAIVLIVSCIQGLDQFSGGMRTFLIIIVILLATVLNVIMHCIWGCIAYLFDDMARSRRILSTIAEYMVKRDERLHPDLGDIIVNMADGNDKKTAAAPSAPSKVYRSIAERGREDAPVAETWICPDCGTTNSSTSSFCKDCGKYK